MSIPHDSNYSLETPFFVDVLYIIIWVTHIQVK